MKHEYQVVYRTDAGPLLSLNVVAAKPEEAASVVHACDDLKLVRVLEIRPLIDWNQRIFTMDEAAEYVRRSRDFITRKQGEGKLPKSPSGTVLFTRAQLDQFVEEGKAA
jgi:hypothetical protein